MREIINSHCHIYPAKIAERAVEGIKSFYDLDMSLNGMTDDLIRDGNEIGVVHYLVHSVATVPKQVRSINEFIAEEVRSHDGLFTGFGTMHPDSEDLEGDFEHLLSLGLKGVKLHPDFQQFALDSDKAAKLGEVISKGNIPILVHCGDPRYSYSNPEQTEKFLEKFPDLKVIGAHFGGWSMWDDAIRLLPKFRNFYVDCSSSLYLMTPAKAKEIIDAFGAERVLWGSDYPMWESKAEMERFEKIDLTEEEKDLILYRNAARFLGLEE
ncbi:MAG: amidohydrolase family protein [Saccharofermentans sp.]|nr:amidohydrolase family protein [Saccharofermentans sp.]